MATLREVARIVAEMAHDGQMDRDGMPHIAHVERVVEIAKGMSLISTEEVYWDDLEVTAWLHDVLEDSELDIESFPFRIRAAVGLLTRQKDMTYTDYIERLVSGKSYSHRLAQRVKLADLLDNLERSLEQPSLRDRYFRALKRISLLFVG